MLGLFHGSTMIIQPTRKHLNLISPLMIVYILVLALIDRLFYPQPTLSIFFYVTMFCDAILLLTITRLPVIQRFLGKIMFPVIISLLVIVPMVANFLSSINLSPFLQRNPSAGPEMEALRLIPLSFTALILVAWLYRIRHIFIFCFAVTLTQSMLFIYNQYQGLKEPLSPWLVVITIQFISFVIVGYFINILVQQLNNQKNELSEANKKLVDYASTLENLTISRERNAMARELHDTVAHTLSGLSVQLETTRAFLDVDPDTAKSMLDRSLIATRSGLQETRRALQSLRAMPLEDLGLIKALEEIAESAAKRGNLQVELHLPKVDLRLPEAYEQVIYRITQEALNNILHHANAKKVQLSLNRYQEEIQLFIEDDGVGFNPDQQYVNHFGLVGMRERAELVGGTFNIHSEVGKGTQVQLLLRNSR
ncbi:MAG: sensor histidine kinase [Anaerolineaceae bacterium]